MQANSVSAERAKSVVCEELVIRTDKDGVNVAHWHSVQNLLYYHFLLARCWGNKYYYITTEMFFFQFKNIILKYFK